MKVLVLGDVLPPRSIEMLARMREVYPDMEIIRQSNEDKFTGEAFSSVWYDEVSLLPEECFEYKAKVIKPYWRQKERY
jgi:hypothetical protein